MEFRQVMPFFRLPCCRHTCTQSCSNYPQIKISSYFSRNQHRDCFFIRSVRRTASVLCSIKMRRSLRPYRQHTRMYSWRTFICIHIPHQEKRTPFRRDSESLNQVSRTAFSPKSLPREETILEDKFLSRIISRLSLKGDSSEQSDDSFS